MLWVQISWTICLFGAELCYANQYLDYYDYDANTMEVSHRNRTMMCALLMSCVCRRFAEGGKPYSASSLRDETGIPIRIVNDLLKDLLNAELIVELTNDEKGETSRFLPAEDIKNLTLGVMLDRLESYGQWKLDVDISGQFSDKWAKAKELHAGYLHSVRGIKLQDLRH
jgi:membrane protein